MNPGVWAGAVLAAITTLVGATRSASAEDLALRRVLLSSGGVGYFEYEAGVSGTVDLPLRVRLDQVDDVLKSLVVYDTSGNLGEVSLPGKEALRDAFRDLPFGEDALASPTALLEALRGAEVRVETTGSAIQGRIASVTAETFTRQGGESGTRHRLALIAGGVLRQVIVEEITRLEIVDATLRAQVDEALTALARQREKGQRELVIHLAGSGERVVRVGFVAEAPLWKSTYRLVLPGDPAAKTAALQGFAVVENQSGQDWKDVELTLTSGDPVTFRQALYDTYYVHRPEVPVAVLNRVLPRPDEGAVAALPSRPSRGLHGYGYAAPSGFLDAEEEAAPKIAGILPAEAVENAAQVVFHMERPVSLASGQTALLPVIERALPVERLSVYQPDKDARHPFAAARLTNDGDVDLPPGAIAVYELPIAGGAATYAGDAQLALTPAGASRLVSFAVDLRVTIDREERESEALAVAKITGGVLELTRTERRITDYTIAGAAREARTILLEHPRIPGFEMLPLEGTTFVVAEVTETAYRLRGEIPAGKTAIVHVVLARPVIEHVEIGDLTGDQLGTYVASGDLSAPVRAALARAAELRAEIASTEARLTELQAERKRITDDQARIRDNLKVVPAGGELASRYLAALAAQEDRLQALAVEISTAQQAVTAAKAAFAEHLRGLNL